MKTVHHLPQIRQAIKQTTILTVLCLISTLFLFTSCKTEHKHDHFKIIRNIVHDGRADLSSKEFTKNTVAKLNGNWFFVQDKLCTNSEIREMVGINGLIDDANVKLQNVPGNWSRLKPFESSKNLSHSGTLILEILLPTEFQDWMIRLPDANSSCKLIINEITKSAIGCAVENPVQCVPGKGNDYVLFHSVQGKVRIVMHVANFSMPSTGTWDSPLIGTPEAIGQLQRRSMIRECLISGAILFMGLYHLFLFLLRRVDRSTIFFAIICLFMAIRTMMMGERVMLPIFPQTAAGWRVSFVVEHLSAHLCLPLFYFFIHKIYPKELKHVPVTVVALVSLVWTLLEICTPPMLHHRFLSWFEYFICAAGFYLVITTILAVIHHREGSWIILSGFIILFIAATNDVLFSNGIIETVYLTSAGVFCFTFAQSLFLARRSSRMFLTIERYVVELKLVNKSLERFIPREMLSYLSKKSITDVHLGDYSDQLMTVFFLDIRNFTTMSEQTSSEYTFKFLNEFLGVIGPIVRANGGFIDKYLGDGFMALFPSDSDNALNAALEMRDKLPEFNATHNSNMDFGIGIHTGQLTLGTIGETQRMDSTVISDTVNTASRLEQLNKIHGNGVLASLQTIKHLRHPENFHVEKIGEEKVKGKERLLGVYRVTRA